MTNRLKTILVAGIIAMAMMVAAFIAGWALRGVKTPPTPPPVADTTWFTLTDTVTLVGPRDSLTRIVWKPYPVAIHDTTLVIRHTADSIFITLPYQHRHFSKPDTLDVWYSGVDPHLDSIFIYHRHTTEIIRQPYEVPKTPRVTLGVGVGAFYNEKQVNPYLWGEMRYNAPKTTWQVYGGINHKGQWAAGVSVTYRMNLIK